ncbi:hypothetical protein QQP08_004817, partial [Theobroma cacao]
FSFSLLSQLPLQSGAIIELVLDGSNLLVRGLCVITKR